MPAPSYTYTLANSTTADADEVMQNFSDILNGVSDGTKDLSVSALTVAGAATFNGTVGLGNATGDTVTFTGYVGSNIIPSTNAARDLGSSSLAWRSLYLDNDSTDGGAIYFDAGSTEFIKANAAGTELEISGFTTLDTNGAQQKEVALYHEAKSADYTVTDTDGVSVVLMTTSTTNRTVTLPTAADNSGRVIEVVKVDSGSGICTVDGEGAETIDGATTYILAKQYDAARFLCNGTEWFRIATSPFRYAESKTMASSGDFSSGTAHFTREGRIVTVSIQITAAHTSGTSASTATGFVPTQFRPVTHDIYNCAYVDTARFVQMRIVTDGQIVFSYPDHAGGSETRTQIPNHVTTTFYLY